jgi:hypothetical protein
MPKGQIPCDMGRDNTFTGASGWLWDYREAVTRGGNILGSEMGTYMSVCCFDNRVYELGLRFFLAWLLLLLHLL